MNNGGFNMLEDKLNTRLVELYFKLDSELLYVDRKDQVPEMRLRRHIDRIEGFLLGCSYIRTVYDNSKVKPKYTPKGGNSVLDNFSEFED